MKIAVATFTDQGGKTAHRIFDYWDKDTIEYRAPEESLEEWTRRAFQEKSALVFVGAMGIAVRTISPLVKNKLEDSPVLVVDEMGMHVIPVLSGHVGGANELAGRIAVTIGAEPVITTATDLNNRFAIDVFACKNHLMIINKEGIARVSGKILAGERILLTVENYNAELINDINVEKTRSAGDGGQISQEKEQIPQGKEQISQEKEQIPQEIVLVEYPPKEEVDVVISTERSYDHLAKLSLCPREYILGIGCKKGKTYEEIEALIQEYDIELSKIAKVATIDIKRKEEGIVQFCNRNRLELVTYSADELTELVGDFTASEFVRSKVGVDNVCERAAMKASGLQGEIVMKKQAKNGITIALVKNKWRYNFE